MPQFDSQIDIDASTTRVWEVLTDFGRYAEWNPLFLSAERSIANGSRVRLALKPPFGRGVALRGKIVRVEAERKLALRCGTLVPGLYQCESSFRIESADGKVRLHHHETYGGVLMAIVAGAQGAKMREGCFALNLAIKRRAEDQDWKVRPRARG